MRKDPDSQYASSMESLESAYWFSDLTRPLAAKFGDGLTLCRDGKRVEWSYHGQSAVIEFSPQGTIDALFIEQPSVDAVSAAPTSAVYKPLGPGYSLTPAGCARMVSDMVDFFSGTREPRFVFSNAYPVATAG